MFAAARISTKSQMAPNATHVATLANTTPIGAAPVSCKSKGKGRQSGRQLWRPPSGHAEGIRKRDLATRHSYTTHCGLRSMMALARRCGDMDVHRTSTALSPDHRCGITAGPRDRARNACSWAIDHIAARQKFVGIVDDQPDADSSDQGCDRGIRCPAQRARPADGVAAELAPSVTFWLVLRLRLSRFYEMQFDLCDGAFDKVYGVPVAKLICQRHCAQ